MFAFLRSTQRASCPSSTPLDWSQLPCSKKIALPNGVQVNCIAWNSTQACARLAQCLFSSATDFFDTATKSRIFWQDWIACGGKNGMLKVLLLERVRRVNFRSSGFHHSWLLDVRWRKQPIYESDPPRSRRSSNIRLSGLSLINLIFYHQIGAVMTVSWNENYQKLTSSDQNGLIIVWTLHKVRRTGSQATSDLV